MTDGPRPLSGPTLPAGPPPDSGPTIPDGTSGANRVETPLAADGGSDGPEAPDRALGLLGRAEEEYAACGRRIEQLGGLCSDPAWNMLLDLFVSGIRERKLSVTAVTIGSRAATATALRYLTLLCAAGLVRRENDERDGRRSYVRLTTSGWATMMTLLDRRR